MRFTIPTPRMVWTWFHCIRTGLWVSWHERNYPFTRRLFWVVYSDGKPLTLALLIRRVGNKDAE